MDRRQRRDSSRRRGGRGGEDDQKAGRPKEDPEEANAKPKRRTTGRRRSEESSSAAGSETWNPPHAAAAAAAMGRASARGGSSTDSSSRRYPGEGVARAAAASLKPAGSKSDSDQGSRAASKKTSSSGRKRRRDKSRLSPPQDRSSRSSSGGGGEDPVLSALIDRLRMDLSEGNRGGHLDPWDVPINATAAKYLLEATSGNIELAASLYFESEAARDTEHAGGEEANDPDENFSDDDQARRADSGGGDADAAAAGAARRAQEEDQDEIARRVRRRLERQFEAADADEPVQADVAVAPNQEEAESDGDDDDDEHAAGVNAAAQVADDDDDDHAGSVSVSDDEVAAAAANRWRVVAGQMEDDEADGAVRARPNRGMRRPQDAGLRRSRREARREAQEQILNMARGESIRRFVSENVVDETDDSKKEKATKEDVQEDSDTELLSEDDWFGEMDTDSTEAEVPTELLWGSGPSDGNGANAQNEDGDAEDSSSADASRSSIGIPSTWINAGFTMSSCGTGLVAKAPSADEAAVLRWSQQQNQSGATAPFHCRGVTVLLSVVTAMIYTGASIQGNKVNCGSARKPFSELSEKERLQEFDSRLTDALSALLFLAAQSSIERRKRFLEKRGVLKKEKGASDADMLRDMMIRRRLRLCPTCRWDEEDATNEGRPPEGQDAGKRVRVSTSYSSIQDIRFYVLSNMRAFTGRGGCALFLETILRMHGKTCIASMIRRARKKLAVKETGRSAATSLIACKCEEAAKQQRRPSLSTDSSNEINDPVGLGHGCVGIELLSLLLTGRVHASLQGWSNTMDVGILSSKVGEVGKGLARSGKNVWILRGETCYSVMWLDGSKENVSCNSSLDKPGCSFHLSHWNCWYGQRNLSGLRVNTTRSEWVPPVQTKPNFEKSPHKISIADSILARRRQQANIVSSDELEAHHDQEPVITDEEVDRVVVNPDDMKFYPKQYRRWTFDLGTNSEVCAGNGGHEKRGSSESAAVAGKLCRQESWLPFYRLNSRQKLVVEMKLAPKINRILWTRWPGATIDSFTPVDGPPPVV